MNGNESYLVLRFGATADDLGKAAISIPFPLNGPSRKLTKISVKTKTPCDPTRKAERKLELSITSSDFGATKFVYLDPSARTKPFEKEHTNAKPGRVTGKFRDCDRCIIPFDTCPDGDFPPPDVRPPYDVKPPVEGTLFLIAGSLSKFEPNTTVTGLIAAVFE